MGLRESSEKPLVGFLVSKPLQLMVAMCIIEQLDVRDCCEIIIVDAFKDAEGVSRRTGRVANFNIPIKFSRDHVGAYRLAEEAGYSKLFIDSDVGWKKNLTLIRLLLTCPDMEVNVYEEGVGTYRLDLYQGWRKRILELAGCGTRFGGNWRTRAIYVFETKAIWAGLKCQVVKIEMHLVDYIRRNWVDLLQIFNASPALSALTPGASGDCVIYLSTWNIDDFPVDLMSGISELVHVKLHPHISEANFGRLGEGVKLMPAAVPAEIIILAAELISKRVIVYHHGSSVPLYISSPNVRYELLPKARVAA